MQDVYDVVGANLGKEGSGALRKIPEPALDELRAIFDHTGGTAFFAAIDSHSEHKAEELGLTGADGKADMGRYIDFILKE